MLCAAEALSLAEYQTWLGEPAESQYFSISFHLFSPSPFLSLQICLKCLTLSLASLVFRDIILPKKNLLLCLPTGYCAPKKNGQAMKIYKGYFKCERNRINCTKATRKLLFWKTSNIYVSLTVSNLFLDVLKWQLVWPSGQKKKDRPHQFITLPSFIHLLYCNHPWILFCCNCHAEPAAKVFKPILAYLTKQLQCLNSKLLWLKTSNVEQNNSSCFDANILLWCAVVCNLAPLDGEDLGGVTFNHLTAMRSYSGVYFKAKVCHIFTLQFCSGHRLQCAR